ncbi:MAG: hypothetical protein HC852_23290 [Acaryochloridaceae cyanobacterium RU_4_10]|nr:hypothetical protein [Acaryochloridaceae cyanobacterium RU_4_10]
MCDWHTVKVASTGSTRWTLFTHFNILMAVLLKDYSQSYCTLDRADEVGNEVDLCP